jgi:hypothetical protein
LGQFNLSIFHYKFGKIKVDEQYDTSSVLRIWQKSNVAFKLIKTYSGMIHDHTEEDSAGSHSFIP